MTETETITFQIPVHQRNSEPEVRELPQELTLGLIVTENIDIFGNESKDTYNELEDKVWQIWVPRGCRLVLFFSEFDLESSPNCTKDYFTIQSTKRQKNIPKYCGGLTSIPEQVTVNKIRTQLHFHSDDTNTRKGIHATFCFQKSKNVSPDDVPCSCNTDLSGIERRHTKERSKSSTRSSSKTRSKSHSNTRSLSSSKSEFKMLTLFFVILINYKVGGHVLLFFLIGHKKKYSKKQMKKMMAEQVRDHITYTHPINHL